MSSQDSVPSSGPRMCNGKNCTFYADPVTGLCSKCYREDQAAKKAANAGTANGGAGVSAAPVTATAPMAIKAATSTAPMAIPGRGSAFIDADPASSSVPNGAGFGTSPSSPSNDLLSSSASPPKTINRCGTCNKKVGLLAFKCRCGQTFCSSHLHADAHQCTFDYKAAGREELAKANPLVVTKKVQDF